MSHIKIELRKEDVDFIKGVCAILLIMIRRN